MEYLKSFKLFEEEESDLNAESDEKLKELYTIYTAMSLNRQKKQ